MTDRVVLIVGGSSGIGLATAVELSRRGDRVTIAARDSEALNRAERACRADGSKTSGGGGSVRTAVMDINVEADVRRTITALVAAEGRIDAVVHTATVMGYGKVEQLPAATFERIVDTRSMAPPTSHGPCSPSSASRATARWWSSTRYSGR